MATAADGTHPSGIHSLVYLNFDENTMIHTRCWQSTIIPLWVLHHNVTEIWVVNVPMMLIMLKSTMSPRDLE